MAGPGTVIDCCRLVEALSVRGWDRASGVPCSTFSGPIEHLSRMNNYQPSANEGLALSEAAGAELAGVRQVVMLQNSGLGNLLNPLSSLCLPYAIPVLALVSLRGWPDPSMDEPQHAVMGSATGDLLTSTGAWHRTLPNPDVEIDCALDEAVAVIESGHPAFLLVPYRSIGAHPDASAKIRRGATGSALPDTAGVARLVSSTATDEAVIFSTTGFASRYLHSARDRGRNFYMQGSMGHASALALGYAAARPTVPVIVLDGDGASIMHLGELCTIGASAPTNLTHVIVDNGSYDSTGSQTSTAWTTDLSAVAAACGYATSVVVASLADLDEELHRSRRHPGPHCIVVRTTTTVGTPPSRAGASLPLATVASRLRGSDRMVLHG